MKFFAGVVVCDGYSAYRKLERENPDIIFAGCWTHTGRYFSDALKALPKATQKTAKDTVAYEALKRIGAIYHLDNQLSDLKPDDRKKQRQITVQITGNLLIYSNGIRIIVNAKSISILNFLK